MEQICGREKGSSGSPPISKCGHSYPFDEQEMFLFQRHETCRAAHENETNVDETVMTQEDNIENHHNVLFSDPRDDISHNVGTRNKLDSAAWSERRLG